MNSSDQVVVFEFKGRSYTMSEMLEFELIIDINSRPTGHVILAENDSSVLSGISFQHGRIHFINSGEFNNTYSSSIDVEIISSELYQVNSVYMYYKIVFECGNEYLNVSSDYCEVKRGTSFDVASKIIENARVNYDFTPILNKKISGLCSDAMKWIYPKNSFWGKLNSTVNRSYMTSDFLFYSIMDVPNTEEDAFIKLDSIGSVMNSACKHIFNSSTDINGDINSIRINIDDTVLYNYNHISYESDLMRNRNDIFPNVNILSVQGGILKSTNSTDSFFDFIKKIENGSGRGVEIESYMNYNDLNIKQISSYGKFTQLKFGNKMGGDIHKYYNISNIYRNFYIASFSKKVQLTVNKTFGPSVGNKVALVKQVDNAFSSTKVGDPYDSYYTDYYFVKSKVIRYDSSYIDGMGSASPFIKTTFNLISGNITRDTDYLLSNKQKIISMLEVFNEA